MRLSRRPWSVDPQLTFTPETDPKAMSDPAGLSAAFLIARKGRDDDLYCASGAGEQPNGDIHHQDAMHKRVLHSVPQAPQYFMGHASTCIIAHPCQVSLGVQLSNLSSRIAPFGTLSTQLSNWHPWRTTFELRQLARSQLVCAPAHFPSDTFTERLCQVLCVD